MYLKLNLGDFHQDSVFLRKLFLLKESASANNFQSARNVMAFILVEHVPVQISATFVVLTNTMDPVQNLLDA